MFLQGGISITWYSETHIDSSCQITLTEELTMRTLRRIINSFGLRWSSLEHDKYYVGNRFDNSPKLIE